MLARARFLKGVRQGDWHFNQPGQQTTGRLRYKDGRLVEAEQRGPEGASSRAAPIRSSVRTSGTGPPSFKGLELDGTTVVSSMNRLTCSPT